MAWSDDKTLPGAEVTGSEWNTMVDVIEAKANLASPTFTGTTTTANLVSTSGSTTTGNLSASNGVFAGTITSGGIAVPTISSTDTLSNKTLSMAGVHEMNNNNITEIKQACFNGVYDDGNSSTADTIDWTNGSIHKSSLTGNVTYTFTAPTGVSRLTLLIYTGGSAYTVTWPASVKWTGGTAPTITTAASKVDICTFIYDGTNYWGTYSQNYSA